MASAVVVDAVVVEAVAVGGTVVAVVVVADTVAAVVIDVVAGGLVAPVAAEATALLVDISSPLLGMRIEILPSQRYKEEEVTSALRPPHDDYPIPVE